MALEWTHEDSTAATAEGWDLFETEYGLELERIDFPEDGTDEIFDGDPAAWAHVRGTTSALHDKALAVLKVENPLEYERVCSRRRRRRSTRRSTPTSKR